MVEYQQKHDYDYDDNDALSVAIFVRHEMLLKMHFLLFTLEQARSKRSRQEDIFFAFQLSLVKSLFTVHLI